MHRLALALVWRVQGLARVGIVSRRLRGSKGECSSSGEGGCLEAGCEPYTPCGVSSLMMMGGFVGLHG